MRQPLTDVTWEKTQVVDRSKNLGWPALADLGYEYAGVTGLPVEDARVLVDFASSGCPLEITWDNYLADLGKWERNTAIAVVECVYYLGQHANQFRVRVRYVGFGHEITSDQLVGVRAVSTVMTFSDERAPMPERKAEKGDTA